MLKTDDILREEMESLVEDLKLAYANSGKKVSGAWEEGLEVTYSKNRATLFGFAYLAGRVAGKMPPVSNILEWVNNKGIFNIESEAQASGIAWAIAKKIAKEGTTEEYHQKVFEQVITPQRIDKIIDRVVSVNVKEMVDAITAEMRLLTQNI
ncbi:MAG: hypothetical protein AAGC43_04690 [Bacteroidota bacterium]